MATRVLAFMAHPDDVEFTCAGTLVRLKQEAGCEIVIATATSGDVGTKSHRPEEISRIRHTEALESASLLDAKYYAAGLMDLFVMYDDPTLRRCVEIVRKARPNVVITHPAIDYMVDHENVSRLVRMACFAAPAPNVITYDADPAGVIEELPHLYYVDPADEKDIWGNPIKSQFVVDVTEAMPTKEKMLACHASQRQWLLEHHNIKYIEVMKQWCAARGKAIDRPFGEGFTQHLGQPYPQNNIIAELLKI
ncbi:MAG: PIG-L deacetylase family protein [Planctomycetota bacterium]